MNHKYAVEPELDPAAFLHRYGHHVRWVPMIASQLDGCRLRKSLSRMKPSALELDRWSMADVRSLPDGLLGELADLLQEVERLAKWLVRLAEGYTALVPKHGPPGPHNTRRLRDLPMVYRLWEGVRLSDSSAWQESGPTRRPSASALPRAPSTERQSHTSF